MSSATTVWCLFGTVKQNEYALEFVSDAFKLKTHVVFVVSAVKQEGLALEYASAEIKEDPKIAMAAIKSKAIGLRYAPAEICACLQIVKAKVNKHGDTHFLRVE